MSQAVKDNLSTKKIQQLLAAVGAKSQEDTEQNTDALEHDWYQPFCFDRDQRRKLDGFTEKVTQAIAQNFAQLYNADFNVTAASTNQYFLDKFLEQTSEQKDDYYLALGTDQDNPFGFIGIPAQTATTWTTQLLGDTQTEEDSERDLGQLEKSLLFDIASALIAAFSNSCEDYDLQPVANIVKGQLPVELDSTDELCKVTFDIKKTESENGSQIYFLMPCSKLGPVVANDTETEKQASPEQISQTMRDNIRQTSVSVTAELASTTISLHEMLDLAAGDILLLDKRIDEPAELVVEGQKLFLGRVAKSAGKHAVVITERCAKT